MTTTRLSPDSWIQAGFSALATQGPSALKAEVLARDLKTTKGSFYWHFKDVPAFHEALLERWEQDSRMRFHNALNEGGSPVQRLRHIAQIVEKEDISVKKRVLEPAIRAWARDHEKASQAVRRVDVLRMEELNNLLNELGLSNPELSRIIYAANLGMAELSDRDGKENDEALGTLVDLVLALYT